MAKDGVLGHCSSMVCIRNYLIFQLVCIPFLGPSVDSVSMMESKLILTRTLTTFGILQHWLYYKGYILRATLKTLLNPRPMTHYSLPLDNLALGTLPPRLLAPRPLAPRPLVNHPLPIGPMSLSPLPLGPFLDPCPFPLGPFPSA